MQTVNVELKSVTGEVIGSVEVTQITAKQSKEILAKIRPFQKAQSRYQARLDSLLKMLDNATTLEELDKLDEEIEKAQNEIATAQDALIQTNLTAISELLVRGEMDGKEITKDNIEDVLPSASINDLLTAINGGLVKKS